MHDAELTIEPGESIAVNCYSGNRFLRVFVHLEKSSADHAPDVLSLSVADAGEADAVQIEMSEVKDVLKRWSGCVVAVGPKLRRGL